MTLWAWVLMGGGLLFAVAGSIASAFLGKTYGFMAGRISGVIGLMGSGKSMFVTAKVLLPISKELSRRGYITDRSTGRRITRIITNTTFVPPYPNVDVIVVRPAPDGGVWDQLDALKFPVEVTIEGVTSTEYRMDAVIVLDEAHLFAPNDKMKLAQKARHFCSHLRKYNAELYWITQNEMKIHKRLRDDTSVIWRPQRFKGLVTLLIGGPLKWFVAYSFEPETMRRQNATPTDRKFFYMSRRVLRAYRSFETIVPEADADVSLDSLGSQQQLTRGSILASSNVRQLVRRPSPIAPGDGAINDETGRSEYPTPERPVPDCDDEATTA